MQRVKLYTFGLALNALNAPLEQISAIGSSFDVLLMLHVYMNMELKSMAEHPISSRTRNFLPTN